MTHNRGSVDNKTDIANTGQPMPSLLTSPPTTIASRGSTEDFTFSYPASFTHGSTTMNTQSPVAPAYSPITPKVQPVLPASPYSVDGAVPPDAIATAPGEPANQYISQPPPQPFSSEDSTDAIALRAAISALQFQKQKARADIKTLEKLRQQALDDPEHFRAELAAGRLKEQRPQFGGLQAILDQAESDSEEDADEVKAGAEDTDDPQHESLQDAAMPDAKPATFARIPGAQDVVRMPHVNWDQYHIVGEGLERLHEQQRKWPGGGGREFAVAAPYSPFLDTLENGVADGSSRTDSTAITTPNAASEHPMETRRTSRNQQ